MSDDTPAATALHLVLPAAVDRSEAEPSPGPTAIDIEAADGALRAARAVLLLIEADEEAAPTISQAAMGARTLIELARGRLGLESAGPDSDG